MARVFRDSGNRTRCRALADPPRMEPSARLPYHPGSFSVEAGREFGTRPSEPRERKDTILEDFTPLSGLVGGMLIGLAATMLLFLNGRIAGISGIVGGMLGARRLFGWRTAFVGGLLLGASGYALVMGGVPVEIEASIPALVFAGLLVGFGTRLGSGCTSGHGVCGIGRMSKRSMSATAVFFTVAIATVFIARHVFAGGAG